MCRKLKEDELLNLKLNFNLEELQTLDLHLQVQLNHLGILLIGGGTRVGLLMTRIMSVIDRSHHHPCQQSSDKHCCKKLLEFAVLVNRFKHSLFLHRLHHRFHITTTTTTSYHLPSLLSNQIRSGNSFSSTSIWNLPTTLSSRWLLEVLHPHLPGNTRLK